MATNDIRTPVGGLETHAGLLRVPPEEQQLFKVMSVENLLRSIEGSYLHFNRVDSYSDGLGADPHDGEQLRTDRAGNEAARLGRTELRICCYQSVLGPSIFRIPP